MTNKKYTDLFCDFDDTLYDTRGNAILSLAELYDFFTSLTTSMTRMTSMKHIGKRMSNCGDSTPKAR